jgi:hypothetical protein
MRIEVLTAAAALAVTSCSLDPAGTAPGQGGASAASTTEATSVGPGPIAVSSSASSSDASSSSAAGGEGGAGGAGGAGGDQGVGGASPEWARRIFGDAGDQVVTSVALSSDGQWVYAAGVTGGTLLYLEGHDAPIEVNASGTDAFVARLTVDGSVSDDEWIRRFGGAGDDQARSIAVGLDADGVERVYVAGAANGMDPKLDDVFAELEPQWEVFAWVIEIDPDDGGLSGGTAWGPVSYGDPVALGVVDGAGVLAVGTCNACEDATGHDVVLGGWDAVEDDWFWFSLPHAGEQWAHAVSINRETGAWALAGELDAAPFDAALTEEDLGSCPLASSGLVDGFVAFYDTVEESVGCLGAQTFGSPGDDVTRAVLLDGDHAIVGFETGDVSDFGAPSAYAARIGATGRVWWHELTPGATDREVRALARRGVAVAVGGHHEGVGFLQLIDLVSGEVVDRRDTQGGDVRINALASDGSTWFLGGRHEGATGFGEGPSLAPGRARDAFVARLFAP